MAIQQNDMKGFHRLSRMKRLEKIQQICHLTESEMHILSGKSEVSSEVVEYLIENHIGFFPIPMGVATGFNIDGKEILIPMAIEETSVIAAASVTAMGICRNGSIRTYSKGQLIIGQIQLPAVKDVIQTKEILLRERSALIHLANACIPGIVQRGGGVRDILIRQIARDTWNSIPLKEEGQGLGSEISSSQSDAKSTVGVGGRDPAMLVIHVLCDPCDAMGANLINQVCEALKPHVEKITGERVGLCILSNLGDTQLVSAEVVLHQINPKLGQGIVEATLFAKADVYRATTHNKGVLNGIDPVLIATGNDWRAVEAGIHAYAARSGRYQPITDWKVQGTDLIGTIEIPLAVGIVGGMTRIHPVARIALKMLQVSHASGLARICAAVGLVQNLGALKALTTVGIVKGHMQLHAANLAIAAGAEVHEIAPVRDRLAHIIQSKNAVHLNRAKEILADVRVRKSMIKSLF